MATSTEAHAGRVRCKAIRQIHREGTHHVAYFGLQLVALGHVEQASDETTDGTADGAGDKLLDERASEAE